MDNQRGVKSQPVKSKGLTIKQSQRIFIIVALIVPVANWLVFYLYTHIASIFMAFQDMATGEWSMVNFRFFFDDLKDPNSTILLSLKNTAMYFLSDRLIKFPASVVICYFLYKKIAGYKLFRIVFYLPNIVSSVVIISVFKILIREDQPIGMLLQFIGVNIPEQGLIASSATATKTIVAYCIYVGLAGSFLIISGALARIPVEVLESARLDGVGPWGELTQMVIPLIWPTLSTLTILACTSILSAGGPILVFTNGNYDTYTMSFYMYKLVWNNGAQTASNYNRVSAVGLCFTVVLVPFVFLVKKLANLIPAVEY